VAREVPKAPTRAWISLVSLALGLLKASIRSSSAWLSCLNNLPYVKCEQYRKAQRLDTSKRRGTLAGACVMENNVSAASFLQRLDIEGLSYKAG